MKIFMLIILIVGVATYLTTLAFPTKNKRQVSIARINAIETSTDENMEFPPKEKETEK